MKLHIFIFFLIGLFIGSSLSAQQSVLPSGKTIYIPKDLQGMDLQNPESKWSYRRMACTENFVIFWEKGFGNDLSNPPQLEGHDMKVDLPNLMGKLESFYRFFRDTLEFSRPGSKCDKYRMMVMLNYSLEGTAYGGDYDGEIGALWIAPNRVQDKKLNCIAHELGHSFQVQNVGDSGWSTPSEIGITGNGSDSNGTTADVCMRVPSENCVVRGSMYVEPMGRDVIFYLYPSNYSEGNNTDMNATMVTESSDGTAVESSGSGSVDNSGSTSSGSLSSSLQSSGSSDKSSSSSSSSKKLESSITEAAKPSSDSSSLDTENPVNSSEGLSLSTAKDGTSDSDSDSGNTSSGNRIFQIALAVVVTGLILLGAVSGVIYFFRKNWKRWGGAEDDDE